LRGRSRRTCGRSRSAIGRYPRPSGPPGFSARPGSGQPRASVVTISPAPVVHMALPGPPGRAMACKETGEAYRFPEEGSTSLFSRWPSSARHAYATSFRARRQTCAWPVVRRSSESVSYSWSACRRSWSFPAVCAPVRHHVGKGVGHGNCFRVRVEGGSGPRRTPPGAGTGGGPPGGVFSGAPDGEAPKGKVFFRAPRPRTHWVHGAPRSGDPLAGGQQVHPVAELLLDLAEFGHETVLHLLVA